MKKNDREKTADKSAAGKLFRRIRLKFTLLVSGLCSLLIAISFVAAYLVNFVSLETSIDTALNDALNRALRSPVIQPTDDGTDGMIEECAVVIVEERDGAIVTNVYYQYGYMSADDIADIVNEAVRNDRYDVTLDGRKYRSRSLEISSPRQGIVFVIYDYTYRYNLLIRQVLLLLCAFVTLAALFVLFSYLVSGRVLSPAFDALVKQKELIANAGHELKTPVTIVNANIDALKSGGDGEDGARWLANIEGQTARMSALITEMLELSSFESAQYAPVLTEFSLGDLIEGICLSFEATCFEKSATLEFSSDEGSDVVSDEKSWTKLTTILLDNAVKYSEDGGKIIASLRLTGKPAGKPQKGKPPRRKRQTAVFAVSNRGKTIPPEEIDKIFERFHKVGDTANSFGLGLAMARTICDNLGGKIKCESADGLTTFTVVIPV